MDDVQQLLKEAARRGYSFKPIGDGKFKTIRPSAGPDSDFESRLASNKVGVLAVLNGKVPSNRGPNPRARSAAADLSTAGRNRANFLVRLNQSVNQLLAPATPTAQTVDPNFPAEHFSSLKEGAKTVGRFLVPESASGKAAALASLPLGGEGGALEKAASVAVPALAGGMTGLATGEGGAAGALQGALAGAAGRVPELGSDILHGLSQIAHRGRTIRMLDNARMSETLGHIVDLPGVWNALRKGTSSWADVFAAKASTGEAGARLEAARDAIQSNLTSVGNAADQEIDRVFQSKYGMSWKSAIKKGPKKLDKKVYRAAIDASDASNFYRAVGARFAANIRQIRTLGRAAYTHGFTNDSLKPGPSAMEAADKIDAVLKNVYDDFDHFNQTSKQLGLNMPDFKAAFDDAQDQYSKFAAIRDMADLGLVSLRKRGPSMQKTVIDALRENPRPFEGRLKGDYQTVKDAVRRGADDISGHDIESTDLPSMFETARIWSHNPIQGRFGFSSVLGSMAHPFGKFIGDVPPLISKVPPNLGVRIAGKAYPQAANRALDLTRSAPVLVNPNVEGPSGTE